MKRNRFFVLAFAVAILSIPVKAQNVGINEDGSQPNANAILDIKSFTKGVLIPRVSTTGRLAIPNTKGLLVYDTTVGSFWYNTGASWQNMVATVSTGGGWSLTGNTGTGNFLGTTDNNPLIIKVNNQSSGRIDGTFAGNTFLGYNSGSSIHTDSALYNSGYGNFSLYSLTTGIANSSTGVFSMYNNTTGNYNTANGEGSLYANISGSDNTASGFKSLQLNTTGYDNTASGSNSLGSNTTGLGNTAQGKNSLFSNTSGQYNTASGNVSLFSNITGSENTATGSNALQNNTSGNGNTASGISAMFSNIDGSNNTAYGNNALYSNKSGWYNTAIGRLALRRNTGGDNTGVGDGALNLNTTGSVNTAVGESSLGSNVSGFQNTAVGIQALYYNTSGFNNTAIGAYANVPSTGSVTNATAIGANTTVNASNKIRLGNSAVTVIEGQVPFTTPSDGRFKFQVKEDVKGLDFIMQLRPVTYQFDTKRFDEQLQGNSNAPAKSGTKQAQQMTDAIQASYTAASAIRRSGFIAQEVEKAATVSGYNFSGIIKPQTEQEHYSLSYESFVVPLVKAMQEQQQIISEQQKKIQQQEKKLSDLAQQIVEIKEQLQRAR